MRNDHPPYNYVAIYRALSNLRIKTCVFKQSAALLAELNHLS